jgi:hypothetical protein
MTIFSAFGALYMNYTVIVSCFYQQITEINPTTGELIMTSRRGYGMLGRQITYGETADYQQCLYYPDEEKVVLEDIWMQGSTFSAYACAGLQLIACVVLFLTCCCAFNRATFERWLMWIYIYASCFMALTFLMFGAHFCKENDCDVSIGSGYAISCWLFLVVSANSVKNMGQPPPDEMVNPDDDEDNLWYDDEDSRFPPRHDDDYDEYGYEEEEEDEYEEEFADGFAYDDGEEEEPGVEMKDMDFLDTPASAPDDNQGGMVSHASPSNPYEQYSQAPPPPAGGMTPHASPSSPYDQFSQAPPPDAGGMTPHAAPSSPYDQFSQAPPNSGGTMAPFAQAPPPPAAGSMAPYGQSPQPPPPPQGGLVVAEGSNNPRAGGVVPYDNNDKAGNLGVGYEGSPFDKNDGPTFA